MGTRTLSDERLAAARRFLLEEGRPLEAALYRFHFEGADPDLVLRELGAFQNADGGFGNALEPDVRAPESSAIATAVAFQTLREVGAVERGELAAGAMRYLRKTLNPVLPGWRIVPPAVETSPHAPWWNQTGRDAGYDAFSLTPTAELLGYVYQRPDALEADVVESLAAAVRGDLAKQAELEMHDLLSCLRLFATPNLPSPLKDALTQRLPAFVDRAVVRDPDQWATYGLRPVQVADRPSSPFFAGLAADVARNLDFEVLTQQPDGSWGPTWTWGDAYPQAWASARREWAGVLTLQKLLLLRRFGRIDAATAANR